MTEERLLTASVPTGMLANVPVFATIFSPLTVKVISPSRIKKPSSSRLWTCGGVEGFNDVIGLDNLCIPALAIMSNRMTDAQGEKVIRFAQQLGTTRVNLMFDCDDPGTAGAKEALWFFAERNITVRLVWSPTNHGGQYQGKQPESLRQEDVDSLVLNS